MWRRLRRLVLSIVACRDIGQQLACAPARHAARGPRGVILEIDPRSAISPYEQLRRQVTALVLGGALTTATGSRRSDSWPTTSGWPAARSPAPTASSRPTAW